MLTWEQLHEKCMSCTGCGLCETRHHVVFGVGNREADVMFVGEGPGEQEDLQGEPFVGAAGKLLRSVKLFDIYRGANLGEGKKSLAFSLELRADDRTLTDADTEPVISKVLTALASECGAVLR